MKKSKLFDIIVYRFLLSLPVSCLVNFIYGTMFFWAFWSWTEPWRSSFSGIKHTVFVYLISSSSIVPFILFNMVRYLAIKKGELRYGVLWLALSSLPEYFFVIIWALSGI